MAKTLNRMIATKGPLQPNGLHDIYLDAWQNSNYLGRIVVNSGAPGHQAFRTVPTQVAGNLEPCPEGEFDLGPLDWAAGRKGNYTTLFREIASPIWVVIMRSRAIGFHLDGNRARSPGSAGCLVFKNMQDLKKFVSWYDFGVFSKLYVDYGLGYVNIPEDLKELFKNIR